MKMDYQGFGHGMIEIAVYISRIIWAALLFGGLAMAGLFAVFFPFLAFIGGPLTFIYGVKDDNLPHSSQYVFARQ